MRKDSDSDRWRTSWVIWLVIFSIIFNRQARAMETIQEQTQLLVATQILEIKVEIMEFQELHPEAQEQLQEMLEDINGLLELLREGE